MATILRVLVVVLAFGAQSASALVCDADADTDVDRVDLNLIGAARGTSVDAGDARDADGDQKVTVIDGRICSQRCTRLGCAAGTPPPAANDDAYQALGNVRISIPAGGVAGASDLLLNDLLLGGTLNGFGPITGAETLPGDPGFSVNGGNLTVNADGSFAYDPPAGFEGVDSFRYKLTSGSGSDTATVTITVDGMIWFVDDDASSGGTGRLTAPFACLVGPGCFGSVAPDDPGDNVFLFEGDYTGGLALLDAESLIGQGASATLAEITGLTLPPGSDPLPPTMPALQPAVTAAIPNLTLAQGNLIRGLDLVTDGATGLSGTDFGHLEVSEVSVVNTNAVAIDLDTGNPAASFEHVSANGGASGIVLQNTTGSFSVSGGTIQNATGAGVVLDNVGNVSLSDMNITNSGTDGIRATTLTDGLTVNRTTISDNSGSAGTDNAIEIGLNTSIGTLVSGTINITDSVIGPAAGAAPHDSLAIGISSGTSTWNVTNTIFRNTGRAAIFLETHGSSVVTAFTVAGSTFAGAGGLISARGIFVNVLIRLSPRSVGGR